MNAVHGLKVCESIVVARGCADGVGLRRDRSGGAVVVRFGRPGMGVQVEDVGLVDAGVAEADLQRVALVGARRVRRVARHGSRLVGRVRQEQAAVLDVGCRDATRHGERVGSGVVGLNRQPGAGTSGELDGRRIAVHPRRQSGLLADAVGAPLVLVLHTLVHRLGTEVEPEPLGRLDRLDASSDVDFGLVFDFVVFDLGLVDLGLVLDTFREHDHRDHVLADLHRFAEPVSVG